MRFNPAQVSRLSDISSDIAQVILASIVIPFAIVVCVLFWVLSIYWSKEKV